MRGGQGVEQTAGLGELVLDGPLVPGDGLAGALQVDELEGGLGAFLGQVALRPLQFGEFAGLAGGDAVEDGRLVEIAVGVRRQEQGESGVDAARAVLGAA